MNNLLNCILVLKNWLKAHENDREYPVEFKQNKNAFRKKVEKYIYDENSKVLYKQTKANDGIGKIYK